MVPGLQITANPQGEGNIPSLSEDILRVCVSCSLQQVCPEFVAGSDRAFQIPVEMRTIEQLRAWATMIIEMQMQRVMMLRAGEEMQGGAPDAALSAELDRMSSQLAGEGSRRYGARGHVALLWRRCRRGVTVG
jgi:hypothetical protein